MLNDLRVRIGDIKIDKGKPDERFDLVQTPPDTGGELAWCTNETGKARRVHLLGGEIGEPRQLLGMVLCSGDGQRDTMFRTTDPRVDDLLHEGADELLARLVALHEIG